MYAEDSETRDNRDNSEIFHNITVQSQLADRIVWMQDSIYIKRAVNYIT